MKVQNSLKIALGCGLVLLFWAFTTSNSKHYSYLYVTQQLHKITITEQGGEKVQNLVKDKNYDAFDFRELLEKVAQLETEGWEMVQNTIVTTEDSPYPHNLFLMRKQIE